MSSTAVGFTILINGVTRSFRDRKEAAYDAAVYLKIRHKSDVVEVRDEATGQVTVVLADGRVN